MRKQLWIVLATCTVWLGLAGLAVAATARVSDEAKFFSTPAIENADRRIQEIQRDFHKDLLVDTVARVPADMQQSLESDGKAAFFHRWAARRAEDADVHGIYILLCKEPGHLQIIQDQRTKSRGFRDADRDQLEKQMLELLRQKKYDAALAQAVDFVAARLRANLGSGRPATSSGIPPLGGPVDRPRPRSMNPPNSPMPPGGAVPAQHIAGGGSMLGWLLLIGLILLGVWVVRAIFRAITGAGRGYGPGPGMPAGQGMPGAYGSGGYGPAGYGPAGYGGGGFLSNLMGGMFGAAAGNWIYDSFFRGGGGGGSGWGSGTSYGTGPSDPPINDDAGSGDFSGPDTGGGGDFDAGSQAEADDGSTSFDGGGGGDFGGGGDSGGGGDFSGGDSGGGGDF